MEQAAGASCRALPPVNRCTGLPQGNHSSVLREYAAVVSVADRIRTGCIYARQPNNTFGLLVTRDDPRSRWRARPVHAPIHAHWPRCAPSIALLTSHETGCRSRHCRKVGCGAEHTELRTNWAAFAAAYRAELEQRSLAERLGVLRQILAWLRHYPTVTVLSFESGTPKGEALLAWEQRREFVPWAQRHIFHEWLVSLLPLVGPGAGGVTGNRVRGGTLRQSL